LMMANRMPSITDLKARNFDLLSCVKKWEAQINGACFIWKSCNEDFVVVQRSLRLNHQSKAVGFPSNGDGVFVDIESS
jgi:hypothetical protein